EIRTYLTLCVIKEMLECFFDVSPDGVLVYLDPMIGTMRSLARHLMIRVNSEKSRLELQHRGQTVQEFALAEGARRACEDAFGAYFEKLQEFCRQSREALAA